jgi:hypothetical protein
MTYRANRPIEIILRVYPDSALLEGLDVWLSLGLLTEIQVRRLCQEHLTCPLPSIAPVVTSSPSETADIVTVPDLVLPTAPTPAARTTIAKSKPARYSGLLQSFMAEVSVLWLLFLGVFLIVVSSAVLAASQWRNFSPVGQYGILFAYTLVFWGISAWASRQSNLQLTARMLQVTTLLIIPVNFWMMDGFKLWNFPLGWIVAPVAALCLTAILFHLLEPSLSASRLTLANSIGLSWLHWGWSLMNFPLIATYIGTIGTALTLFYQSRRRRLESQVSISNSISLGGITITFATLLLVGRAILAAKIPISNLGLALGICGWLLGWLSWREPRGEIWSNLGWVLLLAGWLVAVGEIPQQAIAVSGLGLWLLADRLFRLKQSADLIALFLVGLQSFWLVWRAIPFPLRQEVIAFGIQLAGNEFMPQALIGLGVFPYAVITLFLAAYLRRQEEEGLALQAEGMALILGLCLTSVSYFNPLVRVINLLLSFITLAVVVILRTAAGTGLIYLTHMAGLVTIATWINYGFPNLTVNTWLLILLGGAIAEWIFSIGTNWQQWRRSSWHLGLVLAAISYIQLFNPALKNPTDWYLAWLVVPAALTLLSYVPNFPEPRLANWLSVTALLAIQPLTIISTTPRLVSLGIATILMLLNTQNLPELVAALLTVGFGLCFGVAVIWEVFSQRMTIGWWVTVLAIAPLILWLLHSWLRKGSSRLHHVYTQATDGWAIALTIPTLTFLIGYNVTAYWYPSVTASEFIVASGFITVGLLYRTWNLPTNVSFYSLALAVELLVASIIASTNRSALGLAIATLALGLTTQLAGDFVAGRQRRNPFLSSWHAIPIFSAILGLIIAHHKFDAYTGLYTFAAALVGIGIGRRNVNFKPISYLSIFGVSAAAYELLIYQLLQAKAGNPGDGLTLLAALATAIAILLRLFTRWLLPYLRLDNSELKAIAHLHWVAGSGLILLALVSSLSTPGEKIWLGVIIILAAYALIQGRSTASWTYAGILELGIGIAYGLHLVLPDSVLLNWSPAIACFFAYFMYVLPWTNWGWSATPWQNSAMLLPISIIFINGWISLSLGSVSIQSLLLVAAFYAWIAKARSQVRLSYLSVGLANWAIIRIFNAQSITEPLWYALLWGGSLLYVAQIDPQLRSPSARETRHLLRCLAIGLICFTALYQAEVGIYGIFPLFLGFLTIGLAIVVILIGIALRVRAFLYIGTLTFMFRVLRQVWLFINDYSLFLWAIGIVVGSLLIWIALTFEARRSQAIAFVQYWMTELENWE